MGISVIINGSWYDSIDHILSSIKDIPTDIDLISIDVDGNYYYIFESIALFKPRVVVIEFNPTIPNDIFFVQDRDFSINQGCSLRALIDLGKVKKYELVAVTVCNAVLVRADEFSKFEISDNSIDAMYSPFMDGRIFHGYDGTIFCAGMDSLIWHGMKLAPDSLQILPTRQRVYRDHLPNRSNTMGNGELLAARLRSLLELYRKIAARFLRRKSLET